MVDFWTRIEVRDMFVFAMKCSAAGRRERREELVKPRPLARHWTVVRSGAKKFYGDDGV
jgi:hypothetical protein